MKIVYPTCCGVDVHKSFLVATIIDTPKGSLQPSYQMRRFSTFNSDLNRFADWLLTHNCLDVCMESTGKYWVPVFNILEKRGLRVVIANPKWVKAVKCNKDDKKDSKWIGELFCLGLVNTSFIPDREIRILRELTRYRYKLVSMRSSEKNRFQNAFTVCNVALDSVVSDMFGKSASAITEYLISDAEFDAGYCVSLLRGTLKKKAEAVVESIDGYEIAPEQKVRIAIVRDHMNHIDTLIDRIDTKQLCCWAGLTPGNNESAGKKKSVKISRAGVYLKPALVQVAHAAVKDKRSSYYAVKYERIAKRRGKKRAIIAIARMILTAIYSILSNGEVWNPVDLYKIDMPEHLKEKQLAKAVKQAIAFLGNRDSK